MNPPLGLLQYARYLAENSSDETHWGREWNWAWSLYITLDECARIHVQSPPIFLGAIFFFHGYLWLDARPNNCLPVATLTYAQSTLICKMEMPDDDADDVIHTKALMMQS